MASALFQGTSLLNMFVHSCRVAAARHCCLACDDALRPSLRKSLSQSLAAARRRTCCGRGGAEFVLCATWSDRNEVSLRRSLLDLATLCRGLLQAFPGAVERSALAASALVPGYVAVKEARNLEEIVNAVENLLQIILELPAMFSRSEVVLTFFEHSSQDLLRRNGGQEVESDEEGQLPLLSPSDLQDPEKLAEILDWDICCFSSNVADSPIPVQGHSQDGVPAAENGVSMRDSDGENLHTEPAVYKTNLSYYHLVSLDTETTE